MPEVINLLLVLTTIYSYILLVRIVLSWLNVGPENELVRMLHQVTEPVLEPVRRAVPPMGMFDLSPLIVFIALHIIRAVLASSLDRM